MTSDATVFETTCGQCGADMLMSVDFTITDDEPDEDGRDIVTVVFHSIELVAGCEHVERVRDNCTIRLAVDPL